MVGVAERIVVGIVGKLSVQFGGVFLLKSLSSAALLSVLGLDHFLGVFLPQARSVCAIR